MYTFTFALMGFFAYEEVFQKHKKYHILFFFISILWLIFHDGFRWGVGTDWNNYYNFFNNCLIGEDAGMEIGYVLFNKAVRSVTENYSVFLVLHAIIVYGLISRSILKYSVHPLFTFFFLYCMMLTYLGMNRQYIAFGICIFSYKYIFERRFVPFVLCIVTAFLFHTSSLMFLIAYFLNKEFPKKYLLGLFFSAVLISALGVINRLPLNLFFLLNNSIGDKLSFYAESDFLRTNIFITILALAKRSIWVILAITYKSGIKNKDENYNFFFNMYFVGTLIYILFNGTVLQVVVARGLLYFNIAEIFLIPYLLSVFKEGFTKNVMFFIIAVYGLLMIEKGINFYKEDLGVDIFRPYNSVFMDDAYDAMKK